MKNTSEPLEPTETFSSQVEGEQAAPELSPPVLPLRQVNWNEGKVATLLGVCYLLFFQITERLPFGGIGIVILTTALYLCLVMLFTVRTAQAIRTSKGLAVGLCVSGLLALPSVLIPMMLVRQPQWAGWPSLLNSAPLHAYTFLIRIPGLRGLLLVAFASFVGVLVSRLVREFKLLLPMAVALALVDIYVVFGGGLVTQAQSGKAPVAQVAMQALTVKLPTTQSKAGASPIQLAIGFADFLFIALFFACFRKFNIPSRQTFLALTVTLALYMLIVALKDVALPALVPIAVVIVGMNLRRFRYDRSEVVALAVAGVLVAALFGGMLFLSRR